MTPDERSAQMNMEDVKIFLSLSPENQLAFLAELQEILGRREPERAQHHQAANTAYLPPAIA